MERECRQLTEGPRREAASVRQQCGLQGRAGLNSSYSAATSWLCDLADGSPSGLSVLICRWDRDSAELVGLCDIK